MQRLLYQIHRWAGVALALFMAIWFISGLVIMYAKPSALGRAEQLANAQSLEPQAGWLSLGQAWTRSAAERQALGQDQGGGGAASGADKKEAQITDARLVRQGEQPRWLVEDSQGRRFALSALDGRLATTSVEAGAEIARHWSGLEPGAIRHLDTGPQDSAVRNYAALRPFHRFAVGDGSRELLVSARTGEVVRDSTRLDRALYWTGNWIHLLRPLEAAGLSDETRRTVLKWLGFFALAGCITGLVIGWQRWRPGWGGRQTYSQGRKHPYREFWLTWHFWTGLIGGSFALLWALSGYLNGNPFGLFSPAAPSRAELARYQGSSLPAPMRDWQPSSFATQAERRDIVELAWRRLGDEAVLIGLSRDGQRLPQPVAGSGAQFQPEVLLAAAGRLAGKTALAGHTLLTDYDSYYYARHSQGPVERPLPVLRVELADAGATRLYLDPQDGRVLLRQDASRRAYRWLWSALHHWDIGWLGQRPVWDAWMLTWVLLGVVLGSSSVVIGWKRLRKTVLPARRPERQPAVVAAPARLATESAGS